MLMLGRAVDFSCRTCYEKRNRAARFTSALGRYPVDSYRVSDSDPVVGAILPEVRERHLHIVRFIRIS
jgi:hypothetical protein